MKLFVVAVLAAAGCGDNTGGAGVPLATDSPWPKFRHDARQTGRSDDVHPTTAGGALWAFQTGKGVFSSPVIAGDGTVYVGSADRTFYAINADGTQRWAFPTGEINDSAGLLDDRGRLYFGSGDGHLRALDAATGALVWDFAADPPGDDARPTSIINWFEGNVAIGRDGTLLAGNDNFSVYGIDRDTGTARFRALVPDQTWSLPAVDPDTGDWFVGTNTLVSFLGPNALSFDATGTQRWQQQTWNGTVAASPMLARNGLEIVGGFDGFVRALDTATGDVRWSFGTRDHIYASPAELPDGTIIQPSADGTVYALDPDTGAQRWAYDTVEPIRSSPTVDGDGNIYLGTGDGRLLVLDPDGSPRWAMKLVTDDRDDLNSSVSLGKDAVYLAGESGQVFSVPYDYCLRAEGLADARCASGAAAGDDLPEDGAVLRYTTGLGAPLATPPSTIDANAPLVLSLFVRAAGNTELALIDSSTVTVTIDPPASARTDVSADRRFVAITPDTALVPDATGAVHVHVTGDYLTGLDRDGLVFTGGSKGGSFDQTFDLDLAVPAPPGSSFALAFPATTADPATSWEMYRLAAPLPTMLPSYNQIGFDSLHYLVGLGEGDASGEHGVAWVIGAKLLPDGTAVPDPTNRGTFALGVTYTNGNLTLDNRAGFSLEAMGATLSFDRFRASTHLGSDGATTTAPQLVVSSNCADIQLYGPFLAMMGLCNPQTDLLLVSGGVLLRPRDAAPVATSATFAVASGIVTASLTGAAIDPTQHSVGILLVDAATGAPVSLDYGLATTRTTADDGSLATVSIPVGANVPDHVRVYVMVDTYPAVRASLTIR